MLIYLHGLNSSSQSAKARFLAERLGAFDVRAPDYPAHRPEDAIEVLRRHFAALSRYRPAVVGSSMGGFYGQFLARHFEVSHLFMINPALTPWTLMQDRTGETMTSACGERYVITRALGERMRAFGVEHPCDGAPTTIFLDRGDEVIDYGIAERLYSACGRLMIWDGGNHAFQHMEEATAVIRAHLEDHHAPAAR